MLTLINLPYLKSNVNVFLEKKHVQFALHMPMELNLGFNNF
ncbi:hypothetical protein HSACCH_00905 [Halanaerobium saccharolyticum subsp. saccharolyticum DSM 6643]|uniref:Uncharacterized protein n=1 Tax=Halanaerobium saccharolyticum subsp. saccharolyticum DSM 6643 TaxID=1293054 RepID=M5DZS3_9FIRM|nr:hypothetical protein HSACCH_00905 [Halanaerobium saccharolyticum subsp. saccharolyticum DSM 6643]